MIVMKLSLKRKKQGRKVEADKLSLSSAIRPRCAKTGKVIWENKATAKHQAEAYRRSKGAKMGAYSCESCQGWHIGHMLYHKRKNKATCTLKNKQATISVQGFQARDTSRFYETHNTADRSIAGNPELSSYPVQGSYASPQSNINPATA